MTDFRKIMGRNAGHALNELEFAVMGRNACCALEEVAANVMNRGFLLWVFQGIEAELLILGDDQQIGD